jgi:hypothetical protein
MAARRLDEPSVRRNTDLLEIAPKRAVLTPQQVQSRGNRKRG